MNRIGNIVVVGLGYVGLPVAIALARKFEVTEAAVAEADAGRLVDPHAGVIGTAMRDRPYHAANHGLVDLAAADKAGDAAHSVGSFAISVTLVAT